MRRPLPPSRLAVLISVALLTQASCSPQSPNPVAFTRFLQVQTVLDLDGLIYVERYNCSQAFTGMPEFCADADVSDTLQFTRTGANTYTVRDVPDTGFLYSGTLAGLTFTWTATSPNGYSESGTWRFVSDASTFAGTSHYVANDNSYAGDCTQTGARSPATPAAPPPIGSCP